MTRYELLERIGVGGMAEIFRGKAVAAGGFEKPVAIKRILPHLSQDTRFVELLIAEAKVLSLLKHRNIVQIFDVGLGDDGQYFLVMEYVDGKDMRAVQRALEAKRRRLPFDLCLHIGAEICEALEHAHTSRGPDGKPMTLVHRDVSPSNVLLSRAGEVKLTDFGIAKRADSDATQGGAVRGKFAYISPEQARNQSLDPRSDVFSVGILLWELICNRRLFSGLDDLSALRAVRDPVIPRPTEIDRSLPPEIDQILMSALAKDRSRRVPSCGLLGQKLRSLRYSLEVTVGDPATELARIIESTEELERESQEILAIPAEPSRKFDLDGLGGESTVIRIRTADAFSARDNDISQARMVIDRFEEEETRQAQLTGDQLRMLRAAAKRDSGEIAPRRPRHPTPGDDDMTRAREPLDLRKLADYDPPGDTDKRGYDAAIDTPPHQRLTPTDDTRLLAPRDRRTPKPLPGVRPLPASPRPPTVPPPTPAPPVIAPGPGGPSMQPSAAQSPPPPLVPNVRHDTPVPFAPPGPQAPYYPAQPANNYPGWSPQIVPQLPPRDATPTTQDSFERPVFAQRGSAPQIAGFQRPRRGGLQPWVLVVGAVAMMLLAFVITRALIQALGG